MAIAEHADVAKAANDPMTARRLYFQAFELERSAALQFLRKPEVEPTRAVLFRSAASLALDCGEFREAERMICHALATEPPLDLRAELRQLYEQMHFRIFLQDSGLTLIEQQIVVSLWGAGVDSNFVPLREVVDRLKRAERLIHRTAERKSGLPFTEDVDAPRAIRERFPIYQRMPMAASYAVVLQVGQSDRQLALPFDVDAAEIVSEVVDCISFYNREDVSALREHIEDPAYLRNFVSIIKRMYPRTPGVSGVAIAGMTSQGEMKVVELLKPPHIPIEKPVPVQEDAGEGGLVQIAGRLFSAQATTRVHRVGIEADAGEKHFINVPEGLLADVVRPYFDTHVVVDVTRIKDGTLYLHDVRGEGEPTSE